MEPRKATDVLLDLESKLDSLLEIVKSQDLNIKILSNKLNALLEIQRQPIENRTEPVENKLPTIEAIKQNHINDPERSIMISSEKSIQVESKPEGFRRTSRPETYSGDNAFLNKAPPLSAPPKKEKVMEIVVPNITKPVQETQQEQFVEYTEVNKIPLLQRVVDKNSKSIFLADVEIINLNTNEKVTKTRTNGAGKWGASLAPGQYRVIISKRDTETKEKIESCQDINVDGQMSPMNLPMLIFKK